MPNSVDAQKSPRIKEKYNSNNNRNQDPFKTIILNLKRTYNVPKIVKIITSNIIVDKKNL